MLQTVRRPQTAASMAGLIGGRRVAAVGVLLGLLLVTACTKQVTIPKPGPAVEAYLRAIEQGDVDAIYALMSEESKRAISREELARIIHDQKAELAGYAGSIKSTQRVVKARAKIRYDDGELVTLELVDGRFRVAAADALPAAAKTPEQALGQLRRVLARRSYAGLMRVLSPKTRAAVERDLRSLVEGLNEPDALEIDVVGDAATVRVPGGHEVKLRREDGVWHIDDFN